MLLACLVVLAGATAATGFELTDVRLALEQPTAPKLPVDGRSNLTGSAASLTYTPGPGLRELVTDQQPVHGPDDGGRTAARAATGTSRRGSRHPSTACAWTASPSARRRGSHAMGSLDLPS